MLFARTKGLKGFEKIIAEVNAAQETNVFALNKQSVQTMVSFESADGDALATLEQKETDIHAWLQEQGFDTMLAKHVMVESVDHPCVLNGMDAAAATILASADPKAYHGSMISKAEHGNSKLFASDSREEASMEGYDNFNFDGFIGVSVVANALAAASSPFSETFFRTVVLAPTQKGLDVNITNPQVYTKKARNASGAAYDAGKKSAVRALIDASILAGHSTKILPIATAAKAGLLVATADVPNRTEEIGGQAVQVRPIKYGANVDLLAISTNDALLQAGAQDETDTLDPAISMGVHYIKLTKGADTAIVKLNIDGQRGALFQATQEGSTRDLQAYFTGEQWVESTTEVVGGQTVEDVLALSGDLGITSAEEYKFKVKLEVNGYVEYVNGNIKVNFVQATIGAAVVGAGIPVTDAVQANLVAAITALDGVGYEPRATRTNSNMRDLGTIIDMSDTVRGRIPARMQSPYSIISPTSVEGGEATMEGMNMITRIRRSNLAVDKLIEVRDQIKTSNGILNGSPAIGSLAGIKPVYIEKPLDVTKQTVIFGSSRSLDELRGAVSAAVVMVSNQLLLDSGYLASIELFTGSQANFEVIVGTDPQISNLLMTSGDNRTLGNGRNYHIASTLDERVRGKIYISVRRTNIEGADPHTFGVHPIMPALIHKAQVSRQGETSNNTILVTREEFAVTCPVLALIDVQGLNDIFTGVITE